MAPAGDRARPQQRAGMVQPGPGAARRQRTGRGARQLSAGGQTRSATMPIRSTSRASAYQEMKQYDKAIEVLRSRRSRSIRCTLRQSSCWRARCSAPATPTRRERALQDLPASDQHKDLRADRPGLWRAGTLLDGDAVEEPEARQGAAMIPVHLVAQPLACRQASRAPAF